MIVRLKTNKTQNSVLSLLADYHAVAHKDAFTNLPIIEESEKLHTYLLYAQSYQSNRGNVEFNNKVPNNFVRFEMWLVQSFWKLCGVFNIDLTYNKFQNVYSVLLVVTCVYNFITASEALCKLDHWCKVFSSAMIGMYTRVLASTTLLSRIAIMVQSKHSLLKYKDTINAFEMYSPTTSAEHKNYKIFSFAVVFVCLSIILPINISRLYYLYQNESHDISLFVYYLFIYIQNLSMCCIETQFVTQCFVIYTRFRGINDDLKKLRNENVNYVKYPFIMGSSTTMWKDYKKSFQCVRYDKDFYRPRLISNPMANAVEILRIKHWLTRQAVEILNNLFGIQMGLSVFLLWVLALFDIYYEIFYNSPSKLLVYGWLFQYSLRLFMIILVAHYTTKQAIKSKSIILDTNNQMLDNSTKEELLLFVNQIRHHSIEFTAYDFFTLNTQVIKSAIAAGTTYLVILVQFHKH